MNKTLIIAEAGVNHNGEINKAKELIDAASESGADVVKFQTFKANKLVTDNAPMADYQQTNTGKKGTQKSLLEKLEISYDAHFELAEYSKSKNIEFLSTPFDIESADFLINKLKLKRIKIGSGLINHAPYLYFIASHKIPLILSTGMCTLDDIENSLAMIFYGYQHNSQPTNYEIVKSFFNNEYDPKILSDKVSLLHCVTNYPCMYSEVNLRAMHTIQEKFGLEVGYSDHSLGVEIPCAAVAMGAKVIEKHYTLDKNLPGPDHKASLDPFELKDMVSKIRHIESALGNGEKKPTESERKNIPIVRMSLTAADEIQVGSVFTEQNVSIKRPGNGVSPLMYWDIIGKTATQSYEPGDYIALGEYK